MDLESLEKRIENLEAVVGIGTLNEVNNPLQQEVQSIQKKLKKDCSAHQLMKIPFEKLQRLQDIALKDDPNTRPLSERIESVVFCDELIRQRAQLIEQFESGLKIVLEDKSLSEVERLEPQLEQVIKEIEGMLVQWKSEAAKLEVFKKEYLAILRHIQQRIETIQSKVCASTV